MAEGVVGERERGEGGPDTSRRGEADRRGKEEARPETWSPRLCSPASVSDAT